MMNSKGMWQSLKNLLKSNKIQTPRRLNKNGETTTSPKEIAEIMNTFFLEKNKEIRKTFKQATMDPISLLMKLIPKPDDE